MTIKELLEMNQEDFLKKISSIPELKKIKDELDIFLRQQGLLYGNLINKRGVKLKSSKQQNKSEVIRKCNDKLIEFRKRITGLNIEYITGIVQDEKHDLWLPYNPTSGLLKGQTVMYQADSNVQREFSENNSLLVLDIEKDLSSVQNTYASKGTLKITSNLNDGIKNLEKIIKVINEKSILGDDIQEEKDKILNLIIINTRVQRIKDYYYKDSTLQSFETYYQTDNKEISEIAAEFRSRHLGCGCITPMTNKERFTYWGRSRSINGYTKGGIIREIIQQTRDGEKAYGKLAAFDKELGYGRLLQSNQGHEFEAYLHAASNLSYDEEEYIKAEKFLEEDSFTNLITDYFNDIRTNEIINIDQAFLLATGRTPLYKGGDVDFLLYKEEKGNIFPALKSYQAKANTASITFKTIVTGLFYLYDFLNGTNFATQDPLNGKQGIKTLKDIFISDMAKMNKNIDMDINRIAEDIAKTEIFSS